MFQIKKRNFDIRENIQIFWRRKFYFFIPFTLSLIIGVFIGITTDPIYESSTVVQISHNQILSGAMQQLVPGVTDRDILTNLNRLITSHTYLKRLCETLNLNNDPKMQSMAKMRQDQYPELSVEEIAELLWIRRLKNFFSIRQLGTDFIQIIAIGSTPDMAFNFSRTLTQIFIDESLRKEVGGIRGALEFSSEQLAIYKKKLEDSEDELRQFKESVVRDNLDNQAIITSNLDQATARLAATEYELREATDRLSFIDSQLRSQNIYYQVPTSSRLSQIELQLSENILKLSRLMLQNSWHDAKVLKINSDIENLRKRFKEEIEASVKSQYQITNNSNLDLIVQKEIARKDIEFLQGKRDALSGLLNTFKASASKAPSRELTLNRLQRQVESNRGIYQTLLQQTRGSEIEEALQRSASEFKFEIIEPAVRPTIPVSPNRMKILSVAILSGIVLGMVLIFMVEYIDYSFKNVDDVEKFLDLPVLATIPKIEQEKSNFFGRWKRKMYTNHTSDQL